MDKEKNVYDIINEYNEEIAEFENKIDILENEIKQMKKEGKPRETILKKQLEVGKLQLEIIGDKEVILRKAFGEIQKKAKDKTIDDKKYIENLHLKDCYYNDLQLQRELLEQDNIDIQLKMLDEDYAKNGNTEEYAKSRKSLVQDKNMHQVQYDSWQKNFTKSKESYNKMTGKDSANIDFEVPYEEYLYQCMSRVRVNSDIHQLYKDATLVPNQDWNAFKEKSNKIFTNGLTGNDKELAEIFSDICAGYYGDGNFHNVEKYFEYQGYNITNIFPHSIEKDENEENKYIIIYDMEDERGKCGIEFYKDSKTGEFKRRGSIIKNDELKSYKKPGMYSLITFEQMNEQVVRHNIEQSMKNETILEMEEVTDPKTLEYLIEKNGLEAFESQDKFKSYLVNMIDKDGNTHYEFLAHSNRYDYQKLSGIKQVEKSEETIGVKENSTTYLNEVDAQLLDEEGNSYYIYREHEAGGFKLAYSEIGKEKDAKEHIELNDSGLSTALCRGRLREFFKLGYESLGVGYKTVQDVLRKFKNPKEKQNEMEEER